MLNLPHKTASTGGSLAITSHGNTRPSSLSKKSIMTSNRLDKSYRDQYIINVLSGDPLRLMRHSLTLTTSDRNTRSPGVPWTHVLLCAVVRQLTPSFIDGFMVRAASITKIGRIALRRWKGRDPVNFLSTSPSLFVCLCAV